MNGNGRQPLELEGRCRLYSFSELMMALRGAFLNFSQRGDILSGGMVEDVPGPAHVRSICGAALKASKYLYLCILTQCRLLL